MPFRDRISSQERNIIARSNAQRVIDKGAQPEMRIGLAHFMSKGKKITHICKYTLLDKSLSIKNAGSGLLYKKMRGQACYIAIWEAVKQVAQGQATETRYFLFLPLTKFSSMSIPNYRCLAPWFVYCCLSLPVAS